MITEVEQAFDLVGYPVKDVVTRTQGICVAVSFRLYGDIRASVCTTERAQHWFEIKRLIKTAPKDGTTFLASVAEADEVYYVLFWNGDYFECASSGVVPSMDQLTYWASIPAPSPS